MNDDEPEAARRHRTGSPEAPGGGRARPSAESRTRTTTTTHNLGNSYRAAARRPQPQETTGNPPGRPSKPARAPNRAGRQINDDLQWAASETGGQPSKVRLAKLEEHQVGATKPEAAVAGRCAREPDEAPKSTASSPRRQRRAVVVAVGGATTCASQLGATAAAAGRSLGHKLAAGPLLATLTALGLLISLIQVCDSQFIGNPALAGDDGTNEVVFVDLRVKDNSVQHHTILYEQIDHVNPLNPTGPSLVLRRGEMFNIVIHLRHNYNKQTDKIRLEFSYGQRPQVGKGTLIYLPITKDRDSFGRDPSKWDARVVRVDGNQLSVEINLPANIAVGVWRFRVSTKLAGSRTIRTYSVKEALYMIFNAWSKDDAVYLSREDARQEYVLNDVGKIYIGSHAKPRGRKWIYGQFQESVLPAVMFMLDKTRLDIVGRSNVVKVARAVSAMVNSHDDNGLLVGNWSGNYGDGLAPWQWTGSASILEKYLQSGGEPVKFGQCWVFAGVTTTALRTLGIPARTVSNFVSAHDTDDSLTVDKFFSEKGDPISDVNSDSIWNFHVWSDAWMARNDLPPGYGGWQAVDATPQETSMGMYQMGPASLEAIKKGEVGFAYDAAFVFAEVNADIVHWQQDDKSELQWKKIKTLKFHIGRKIFTKMIGQLDDYTANGVADAEDIISQYKNKEGTEDERMSVLNAARCGGLGFLFEQPAPGKEDVEFELFDIDKVQLGEPFLITVRISNKSPMRRTASLALSASSVYYTGILAQKVKRDRQNVVLNGLQEQLVRIRVNPEDYLERLVDFSMMKVYAIATVKETQQTWSKEDDFMIEKSLVARRR